MVVQVPVSHRSEGVERDWEGFRDGAAGRAVGHLSDHGGSFLLLREGLTDCKQEG